MPVKLVVFAHVPPPHHGQSAMVRLMLDGLRSGEFGEFEIHHVDARFSNSMEEIGGRGLGKGLRAVRFALRAIAVRFRHGARTLYYIPAPPKASAMVRDWIVLALCRPFFPRVVFHWHAVGLGEWTERARKSGGLKNRLAAILNRLLLGGHQRSIVLTEWGRRDVAVFSPESVVVVGNGIADPCPDFDERLLARREVRIKVLRQALRGGSSATFEIRFLGHCTAEKGLLDAMEGTARLARRLRDDGSTLVPVLRIAGEFPSSDDRKVFDETRQHLTAEHGLHPGWIEHLGFVGGEEKRRFLESGDCLCFPTRYPAESFGLVAVEALAFGISAVTSDWRMLPEIMAGAGLPVARAGDPEDLARALEEAIGRDDPARLRSIFLERFSDKAHLPALANALDGDARQ